MKIVGTSPHTASMREMSSGPVRPAITTSVTINSNGRSRTAIASASAGSLDELT